MLAYTHGGPIVEKNMSKDKKHMKFEKQPSLSKQLENNGNIAYLPT
jgi:hypothetical protein